MTINTQIVNISPKVRAFTVKNSDDSYTIFLNDKIGYRERLRAYRRELRHIENGDFYRSDICDVQQIEHETHNAI